MKSSGYRIYRHFVKLLVQQISDLNVSVAMAQVVTKIRQWNKAVFLICYAWTILILKEYYWFMIALYQPEEHSSKVAR